MAVAHKQRKLPPRHRRNALVNENGTPVAEMIGRVAPPYMQSSVMRSSRYTTTVDGTIPDYEFYDKLRRGKQPGYRLGALFAKRIEKLFSAWVFGEGVDVTLNKDVALDYDEAKVEYTNEQLKNFVGGLLDAGQDNEGDDPDIDDQNGSLIYSLYEDAMGLGDQYPIINANGSISVPSPDTVEVLRDPLDYRKVLLIRITAKYPKATIIDEYRPDGRTVTIKQVGADGKQLEPQVEHFTNLIGRIPFVHIAHDRSGNETNGHSIHEDLLKLYDQYDDVIHKQLDGAKLLGNPILAFVGMENIAAVIDANKPITDETYLDRDGNEVTRPMLNVDANSVMLIGKGGDGKFIAPPTGFTADTTQALRSLFLLILWRLGITESLWGGELSSARATSETQLTQFAKELRGLQKNNGGWVARLCKIWLQFKALTDPQIIVDKLSVEWPSAVQEDKALLLEFIKVAKADGLIEPETELRLLELVDDPEDEVKRGQAAAQVQAQQEHANAVALIQAKPQAKPGAFGEMEEYNGDTATAIVVGAIRQLAGGE